MFEFIRKTKEGKLSPGFTQRGLTYVELIVVLSIFAVMSGVLAFNYGAFRGNVDIKNLSSDVALKLVEAQNSSLAGKWNASASTGWKPAYGVYFDTSTPSQFIYFADLDTSDTCTGSNCFSPYTVSGEVQNIFNVTGSSHISNIQVSGSGCPATVSSLTVLWRRPDSAAVINTNPALGCTPTYVAVVLTSTSGFTSQVRIYPSGRIQIN